MAGGVIVFAGGGRGAVGLRVCPRGSAGVGGRQLASRASTARQRPIVEVIGNNGRRAPTVAALTEHGKHISRREQGDNSSSYDIRGGGGGGGGGGGAARLAAEVESYGSDDGGGAARRPHSPRKLSSREAHVTSFVNNMRQKRLGAALAAAEHFLQDLEAQQRRRAEGDDTKAASQRARALLYRRLYNNHRPFLQSCLAGGRLPLALRYMELLPPDKRAWSLLLQTAVAAAREGQLQQPLVTLRKITAARTAAGLPPDEWTSSALLSAARFQSDTEAAAAVFEAGWAAGQRGPALCSAMLAVHADGGQAGAAVALVQSMRRAGVPFDAVVYGSYFRALGSSANPAALQGALEEMEADGIGMDARLASAALTAGMRCGVQEAEWFRGVYGALEEAGVAPTSYTLCDLFTALSRCPYLEIAEVDAAFAVMAAFRQRSRAPPAAEVYTALLSLCVKADQPFRLLEVWETAQEDGLEAHPAVVCALLSCAAAAAKQGRAHSAEAVFSVHALAWRLYKRVLRRSNWPSTEELSSQEGQPRQYTSEVEAEGGDTERVKEVPSAAQQRDMVTRSNRESLLPAVNAMLHFCTSADLADSAVELLAVMRSPVCGGPAPDAVSFNTVIAGLAAAGRHQHGAYLLKEMQADGVTPDAVTMAALVHACARSSNLGAAEEVVGSMVLLDIEPTVEVYSSLMDAHVQNESPASLRRVFCLLDEMMGKGISPTDVTYIHVLRACLLLKDADRAFAMYERAYDEGVVLNDKSHNLLIKVCTVTGRLNEGVELVKRVARIHGELQSQTLNALIRALSSVSVDRALRMLSLMRTLGMTPSTATVVDLIHACAADGNAQAAYSLYRGLCAAAQEVRRVPGSALIRALCKADDSSAALQVYQNMLRDATPPLKPTPPSRGRGAGAARRMVRPSLKYHCLPTPAARSSIALMLSRDGNLDGALEVVAQMAEQEGVPGLQEAAVSNKQMFQELITSCCRAGRISDALHVFDEWKAAFAVIDAGQGSDCCLNNAVLAFLEASCRAHGAPEWRVFDVIAIMRQQREMGKQAKLERPSKRSHHFTDTTWVEGEA